jgi:RND family efflux transporter MFP subunit
MNNPSSELLNELRIDRTVQSPVDTRHSSGRRLALAAAAIAVVALLAWWLLRAEPVLVRTAAAQAETSAAGSTASSVLDATGYVTARRQATVSAKITGKVEEVLIEEGQRVTAGEVLARLEPTDANAQRALSAAQLSAARSEVTRARAQLLLADKNLVRSRDLAEQQLVAESALDQALAERDALAAQLQSTQRNVEVAERSLALAEIGVDNTVVRAPFDGVITVKAAQPGEIISPISAGGGFTRTGIGTVVDMDSLEVQVDINEAFIGRVTPRQKVQAVLNAYPDWIIPAEVIAIVPTADRSKATVKVRIAFLQRDQRIVPDMGVRVSFLEPAQPASADAAPIASGASIADEAVVERDGRTVVFVVGEGKARLRAVQVDAARNGKRRVTRGLAVGEQVVLSPPENLRDGDKVRSED